MEKTKISRFATVLLWLFVINLGIALGAGLFESRIVVPDWIEGSGAAAEWNPDVVRQDDTGRRFWVAVTTVPLTLLTLANLVVGWRAPRPVRRWWLGAAGAALADRVFTLGYFVPTMIGLLDAPNSADSVAAALRWVQLNHVRHVIVVVAFLAALKTFAVVAAYQATRSESVQGV